MNTESLINSTLDSIDAFSDQFHEMPGATEFLRDCSEDLKQGLAQAETLTPDDQRRLLDKANEVLALIAAEWDKCEAVLGNHLRLAIVGRLRENIRVAIRALNKLPA
jgi:hypothetical protein